MRSFRLFRAEGCFGCFSKPGKWGSRVLEEIRLQGQVPVIMTPRETNTSWQHLLAGANDYHRQALGRSGSSKVTVQLRNNNTPAGTSIIEKRLKCGLNQETAELESGEQTFGGQKRTKFWAFAGASKRRFLPRKGWRRSSLGRSLCTETTTAPVPGLSNTPKRINSARSDEDYIETNLGLGSSAGTWHGVIGDWF